MSLENKVVVITGGGSGIGRESALMMAKLGASIALSDVNVVGGEETAQMVTDLGQNATFIKADVTNPDDVDGLIQDALERFGRIDCAVNNAGISGSVMSRIHETDDKVYDHIMNVNVKGVWLCLKRELAIMLEQGSGSIVNVASVAGLIGAPKIGAYAASKHAVLGLTKNAAVDYAKFGIRVNAICPAYTDTPMVREMIEQDARMAQITVAGIPMRRLGQPQEIAEAIVWLCSDASSFVTGHALTLDGGLTIA